MSSALHIQQTLKPKPNIVIVANNFPGSESIDYATPWAGAHYRPIPDVTPQGTQEALLCQRTYEAFKSYAAENPDAGISFLEGVDLLEMPLPEYVQNLGSYRNIDDFRLLPSSELPSGVVWGASYKTWSVNTPVYTAHLLRKFISGGGKIKKVRLESLEDALSVAMNVTTVINCSGVGFADPASFITRGKA